jgi:hypothetical protein
MNGYWWTINTSGNGIWWKCFARGCDLAWWYSPCCGMRSVVYRLACNAILGLSGLDGE